MRRAGWAVAALALLTLVGATQVTLARFHDAGATRATLATGSLLPPTSVAGTGGSIASLSWTPTTSTAATGYHLQRSATSGSGYATVADVTPVGATGTSDAPGGGTWYYVLRTYLGAWTSAPSNEASVTITTGLTGYRPCAGTSNAADTGGDDNGYETAATSACVADGTFATDASSGTNAVDSCANAGKDRHRFWGFDLGLPASVTSIDGIELQLVAGMSNSGGTTRICAELSWDGGTTWTAAKSVSLTANGLTTYALGGAADTWGRAWTAGELGGANLRLRLTDVTTHNNKTFRLDGISIQVAYSG